MKVLKRVLAILITGVLSVIALQYCIRRFYNKWHHRYLTLVPEPDRDWEERDSENPEAM